MTPLEKTLLIPGDLIGHQTLGQYIVLRVDDETVYTAAVRVLDQPEHWAKCEPPPPPPPVEVKQEDVQAATPDPFEVKPAVEMSTTSGHVPLRERDAATGRFT